MVENFDAKKVRSKKGFDIEEEEGGVDIVYIVNSSKKSREVGHPEGAIVTHKTNKRLAEPEKKLSFAVLRVFKDWTIWEDSKPKKRTYSKNSGKWSDGTPIAFGEIDWVGSTPPLATESTNFVVIPEIEFYKEKPKVFLFPFQHTNSTKRTMISKLLNMLEVNTNKYFEEHPEATFEEMPSICKISLKTGIAKNKNGDEWFDVSSIEFDGYLDDADFQNKCSLLYDTEATAITQVKNTQLLQSAPGNLELAEGAVVDAEIVEEY